MYHLWKIFHAATKRSKILHATTIIQSSQIKKNKNKNKKNFFKMTRLLYEAKDNIPQLRFPSPDPTLDTGLVPDTSSLVTACKNKCYITLPLSYIAI